MTAQEHRWKCKQCTHDNPDEEDFCDTCFAPRKASGAPRESCRTCGHRHSMGKHCHVFVINKKRWKRKTAVRDMTSVQQSSLQRRRRRISRPKNRRIVGMGPTISSTRHVYVQAVSHVRRLLMPHRRDAAAKLIVDSLISFKDIVYISACIILACARGLQCTSLSSMCGLNLSRMREPKRDSNHWAK